MKKIIYITFVDFDNRSSGSSLRPAKMYEAFLERGYEVELLTGLENRRGERWRNVLSFMKRIKHKDYDFCYVEPPSGPMMNLCDHLLLRKIKRKNIPIALFYRDAYWKFADWYQLKGIKRFIINTMHKFDWHIFKKTCAVIFYPSKTMSELFEFKHKDTLPPGGENLLNPNRDPSSKGNVIYVGGLTESYGGKILMEAMDIVNKHKDIKLHVVCRESELKYIEKYKAADWIHIYHLSGDKLKEVYDKCDLAVIPRKKDFYMDFAMPVKLLEYMSYGKPLVVTNCTEVANFVNQNHIGMVSEDNAESLAEAILEYYKDEEAYETINKNVEDALLNGNLWVHRVDKIEKVLSPYIK